MPFTNRALAMAWLLILGLFALSGSGTVVGPWVLLLVAAALGVPLILAVLAKPRRAVNAPESSVPD